MQMQRGYPCSVLGQLVRRSAVLHICTPGGGHSMCLIHMSPGMSVWEFVSTSVHAIHRSCSNSIMQQCLLLTAMQPHLSSGQRCAFGITCCLCCFRVLSCVLPAAAGGLVIMQHPTLACSGLLCLLLHLIGAGLTTFWCSYCCRCYVFGATAFCSQSVLKLL